MLKNIIFGVKVATNDDFCQGTVQYDTVLESSVNNPYIPYNELTVSLYVCMCSTLWPNLGSRNIVLVYKPGQNESLKRKPGVP